jgi:hypothetical protein
MSFVKWVVGNKDEEDEEKKKKEEEEKKRKEEEKKLENHNEESLSPDEMRKKRLEKLAVKEEKEIKEVKKEEVKEEKKPVRKLEPKKTTTNTSEKKTIPVEIKKVVTKKTDPNLSRSGGDMELSHSPTKKKIPIEKFINDSIQTIFKITLNSKKPETMFYLESLAQYSKEERIDISMLEVSLVERLSAGFKKDSPLLYLAACYRRANDLKEREESKKEVDKDRVKNLKDMRRLVSFYFGLVLSSKDGDYFPDNDQDSK